MLFEVQLSLSCLWGDSYYTQVSTIQVVLPQHLVQLSLNRRSDIFCDFMLGQSVLATCILAQKYNLHFLEGEVWFRDFIG